MIKINIIQKRLKKSALILGLMLLTQVASAQIFDPAKWSFSMIDISETEKELVFKVKIDAGWHLYGMNLPEDGPRPTHFSFTTLENAELVNQVKGLSPLVKEHDVSFDMVLSWYVNQAEFRQRIKITSPSYKVEGFVEFMLCNNESCLPPKEETFLFEGKKAATSAVAKTSQSKTPSTTVAVAPQTEILVAEKESISSDVLPAVTHDLWKPVIEELSVYKSAINTMDGVSYWQLLFLGFIGGLLALLTPCVWPLIPMTVSFFIKRSGEKKKAVKDALLYGASIVVIYVLMGLLITLIFGASALNNLATNAIFNIIFFLLLFVFGISFLGAFEITLPSSWSTKLDARASKSSGILSIFFMAFTLALVSFSCTGPIIGTLLVQAATSGSILSPAIGMFGFALALAIPFALFALFPTALKKMPKSGGWLNSVKVVLGFLELALSLKFLSVADLAYGWGLLDREVYIVLWVVIFAFLGMYLLGKLRFEHDDHKEHTSVSGMLMSVVSFAFALYLIPGLWGAPLKAVSAFLPPMSTQDFILDRNDIENHFSDYEEGMAQGKRLNKPVLIDFSGYGCVNCRKMEAAVFTDQEVKALLDDEFVVVTLMVDDKQNLEVPIQIVENERQTTLKTVGDKWSYLQRLKFGANAQPFFVILDKQGLPLTQSYAFDEDPANFVAFLKSALDK